MPRPRVTVFIVKSLSWAYNDECTVPHSAEFERAFRTRERAELYRRELELHLFDTPPQWYDEPRDLGTNWPAERVRAWVAQFGLPEPPVSDYDETRFEWTDEWLAAAQQQLGREAYVRFCELFDRGARNFHVVETELEL